jgi:hypothetical protein
MVTSHSVRLLQNMLLLVASSSTCARRLAARGSQTLSHSLSPRFGEGRSGVTANLQWKYLEGNCRCTPLCSTSAQSEAGEPVTGLYQRFPPADPIVASFPGVFSTHPASINLLLFHHHFRIRDVAKQYAVMLDAKASSALTSVVSLASACFIDWTAVTYALVGPARGTTAPSVRLQSSAIAFARNHTFYLKSLVFASLLRITQPSAGHEFTFAVTSG